MAWHRFHELKAESDNHWRNRAKFNRQKLCQAFLCNLRQMPGTTLCSPPTPRTCRPFRLSLIGAVKAGYRVHLWHWRVAFLSTLGLTGHFLELSYQPLKPSSMYAHGAKPNQKFIYIYINPLLVWFVKWIKEMSSVLENDLRIFFFAWN